MAQGEIKKTDTRIQVQITKDDKALLDKIAKKEGRSISNLARHIITQYLNEQKNKEYNQLLLFIIQNVMVKPFYRIGICHLTL